MMEGGSVQAVALLLLYSFSFLFAVSASTFSVSNMWLSLQESQHSVKEYREHILPQDSHSQNVCVFTDKYW